MIGVSYSFVGPVEDPKLIHMVMIAQFWPTNHHPDDETCVFTIHILHFTSQNVNLGSHNFKVFKSEDSIPYDNDYVLSCLGGVSIVT